MFVLTMLEFTSSAIMKERPNHLLRTKLTFIVDYTPLAFGEWGFLCPE